MKLFKPSSQMDDPEGWIGTQVGHTALGVYLCISYLWVILQVTGNYPDQTIIAFLIPSVYFLFWEVGVQGWKGRDSLEDSFFVAFGASLLTAVDIGQVIDTAFIWVNSLALVLAMGFIIRVKRMNYIVRRSDKET